uniref:Uncharacterized protein n=1 Tax=Arundo donax TaxID=35708 RepID=A0A0A9H7T4_ARUDO
MVFAVQMLEAGTLHQISCKVTHNHIVQYRSNSYAICSAKA